jgi:hypothetical protein
MINIKTKTLSAFLLNVICFSFVGNYLFLPWAYFTIYLTYYYTPLLAFSFLFIFSSINDIYLIHNWLEIAFLNSLAYFVYYILRHHTPPFNHFRSLVFDILLLNFIGIHFNLVYSENIHLLEPSYTNNILLSFYWTSINTVLVLIFCYYPYRLLLTKKISI